MPSHGFPQSLPPKFDGGVGHRHMANIYNQWDMLFRILEKILL